MPKSDPALITEGRLRFAAAHEVSVRAATPLGSFRLFKIQFGNDGSIYIPFPGLKEKRGILSEADPATEPDPKTLQLKRNGVVVDYDVKFAHHTSGEVHFSKTGKRDDLPRRQSFPLNGPIGRLFWFNGFRLDGFNRLTRADRRKELGLDIVFPTHPTSVQVNAKWLRKRDIQSNLESPYGVIGPNLNVESRTSGEVERCIVIGQPSQLPLQEHVVMISATEVPLPNGADSATTVFCGGWDPHEGTMPATSRMLVCMYPLAN